MLPPEGDKGMPPAQGEVGKAGSAQPPQPAGQGVAQVPLGMEVVLGAGRRGFPPDSLLTSPSSPSKTLLLHSLSLHLLILHCVQMTGHGYTPCQVSLWGYGHSGRKGGEMKSTWVSGRPPRRGGI